MVRRDGGTEGALPWSVLADHSADIRGASSSRMLVSHQQLQEESAAESHRWVSPRLEGEDRLVDPVKRMGGVQ